VHLKRGFEIRTAPGNSRDPVRHLFTTSRRRLSLPRSEVTLGPECPCSFLAGTLFSLRILASTINGPADVDLNGDRPARRGHPPEAESRATFFRAGQPPVYERPGDYRVIRDTITDDWTGDLSRFVNRSLVHVAALARTRKAEPEAASARRVAKRCFSVANGVGQARPRAHHQAQPKTAPPPPAT